jgi:hypothetical protein
MDKIVSIDLSTSTAPLVQEVRGKDYIEYGDANGEWRNLYPQFLIDLYYSSSITAAIVNATAEMISAEDLVITDEDDRDEEARVKLQNFMNNANGNETLHEVLKKVAFDFKLQGGFALNIVWARDRSKGIVTKGILNLTEKAGTEQVQYTQHPEPSGTNTIYYGQ